MNLYSALKRNIANTYLYPHEIELMLRKGWTKRLFREEKMVWIKQCDCINKKSRSRVIKMFIMMYSLLSLATNNMKHQISCTFLHLRNHGSTWFLLSVPQHPIILQTHKHIYLNIPCPPSCYFDQKCICNHLETQCGNSEVILKWLFWRINSNKHSAGGPVPPDVTLTLMHEGVTGEFVESITRPTPLTLCDLHDTET